MLRLVPEKIIIQELGQRESEFRSVIIIIFVRFFMKVEVLIGFKMMRSEKKKDLVS